MKRILSALAVFAACVLAAYSILSTWMGFYPYQPDLPPAGFLKALQRDSSNPDPFYRLGVFHQWEIRHIDLPQALHYLKEAINRNPLEQEYWLSLATVFQRMDEPQAAAKALKKAIMISPTGYQGQWAAGNFFLQRGEYEKALPYFSFLLQHYPNQSNLIYEVCRQAVKDPDFLLARLIPQDPFSLSQYLSYQYEIRDKETAKKVWSQREALGYKANRSETLQHVEFLISGGDLSEAYRLFTARMREEGLPVPPAKNLIMNGGFEQEKILGGGFDWRIASVPGAKVSFDQKVAFAGKSSLKIVFDGKENVDFRHVYQFVTLKPDQEYLLSARLKTEAVTTKSGIKLEITGIGGGFHKSSEALTGDNDWQELSLSWHTPKDIRGGIVRLRREKTAKFDRFIAGTVWVDNVQLIEKKSH